MSSSLQHFYACCFKRFVWEWASRLLGQLRYLQQCQISTVRRRNIIMAKSASESRTRFYFVPWILAALAYLPIMECQPESCNAAFQHPELVKQLADGNMEFALNLYKKFVQQTTSGSNVFFSPFSILVALGMTSVGARTTTAEELERALKFDAFSGKEQRHLAFTDALRSLGVGRQKGQAEGVPFVLHTANRLFLQHSDLLEPEFQRTLSEYYATDVGQVNFVDEPGAAATEINRWVEDKTNKKIQNLIPDGLLTAMTCLVLVNAIYFKGKWLKQFDPRASLSADFKKAPDNVVKTRFMRLKARFPFVEDRELQCKLLELPYAGNRLVMGLLLPDSGTDLDVLEGRLTLQVVRRLMASMQPTEVRTFLPTFKIEASASLNDVLGHLGIRTLFCETSADLSGISQKCKLYVSHVLHKAFVEVNEEGTEAAAATAVAINCRSMSFTQEFIADHPFLFYIFDKQSELILFLGRLADPSPVAEEGKNEL